MMLHFCLTNYLSGTALGFALGVIVTLRRML